MIPAPLTPLANHVWQSTLFAGAAALLTLALRRNRAKVRYWLWMAASLKFLIPFSLLVSAGSRFDWGTAANVATPLSLAIDQISQPFEMTPMLVATGSVVSILTELLAAVWFGGGVTVLALWWMRWRRIRAALRTASRLPIQAPVAVMSSPTLLEPGVFGIWRPVLLLPEGIAERLTPAQFQAILAHELCHVRRRDNLAAAIHMIVEAAFWFHPLVWWIGARLVEERERACDEEVLRQGSEPEVYATGIVSVCKFYVASPLACASGVTGSDLKKRVAAIMANRISSRLTPARKLLLATAGIAAVAGPILIGIVNTPRVRAQVQTGSGLRFEVASIKPSASGGGGRAGFSPLPGGGLSVTGGTLRHLITFAYDVQDFQVSGGPGWLNSAGFDVLAKPERTDTPAEAQGMKFLDRIRERTRYLLAERFQLAVHKGTTEGKLYELVVAKNGPKLQPAKDEEGNPRTMRSRGRIDAARAPLAMLVGMISNLTGRPVVDRTGLTGKYDYKVEWTPDTDEQAERGGMVGVGELSTIFAAMQDQIGLRVQAAKGPIEMIVIDRAEKPSAN